jgi:O-antigen/teichoic acid export membrane protein
MWAIADQAIVSAGNFITNIVLANALLPTDYGLFGLLLGTILFLNSLQAALVTYPLSVKGATIDTARVRPFTAICLILTLLCALPLAVSAGLAGAVFGKTASIACWAAVALILWQSQETLRRILNARLRFRDSIWGDSVRYLGQAVIVLMLAWSGTLSIEMAFASIALASVLGGLYQAWQVGMARPQWQDVRAFGREFWNLGRWMLAANLTFLVSTLTVEYGLAYRWGMDAMGKFQALSNIVKLSHPLLFGIGAVVTPVAARAFSDGGTRLARSVSGKFALQGLALLLPFYALLLVFPTLTLRLFYPTMGLYHGLENELRVYVLWYLVLYAASVLGAYLAGLERARHHFQAQLVHALGAATIAVPLTWFTGLTGMLIGGTIAKLILCFAILHYIRRAHRDG